MLYLFCKDSKQPRGYWLVCNLLRLTLELEMCVRIYLMFEFTKLDPICLLLSTFEARTL